MIRRKPKPRSSGNTSGERHAPDKDQLLCELELQRTRAELQSLVLLEKMRNLEAARDHYRTLYDCGPTSCITIDEKAVIEGLNLAAAKLAGMERDQIVGLPFTLFVPQPQLAKFLDHLRRCRISPGQTVETEIQFRGRGKHEIPVQMMSLGFRRGDKTMFQTILIDARWRKANNSIFFPAKEYADKIVQTVAHPLLVLDENLMVASANPAFYQVFKLRPKDVKEKFFHCADGDSPSAAKIREQLLRVIEERKSVENSEFTCELPNQAERNVLMNAQAFVYKGHPSPLILVSLEDITRRHLADREREKILLKLGELTHELEHRVDARTSELEEAHSKLQAMSARMVEAQEMERHHLARELHDEIGQQITCLQILTEHQLSRAPAFLAHSLKESRHATSELQETVRQLSADLRPQLLDDFGLAAALEWHFKRFHKRTGIKVRFNKSRFRDDLLNSFLRNVIFRVTQEALTNVARHAGVKQVAIQLSTNRGLCLLQVRDEGKGFEMSQAMQKGSFGLSGMQERVFLAGGTLKISSALGRGTTVALRLPLISPQTNTFDSNHLIEPS